MILFCFLTFLISWSIWGACSKVGNTEINLNLSSLHVDVSLVSVLVILGNVAPGLIALLFALAQKNTHTILSQLRPPKGQKLLYVFTFFMPIVVTLCMFLFQKDFQFHAFDALNIKIFIRIFLINIFLGPLWEEIAWRGYLLPTLLNRMSLGSASLVVGVIWASWHFVLYRSVFRFSTYSVLISFSVIVAMSVVLAVVYSASGNTLWLTVVFHTSWNAGTIMVTSAEQHYTFRPVFLEAVFMWILAGIASYWHRYVSRSTTTTANIKIP